MEPRTTSIVHWSSPSSAAAAEDLPVWRSAGGHDQCVPFSPPHGTGSTLYRVYSSMGIFAERRANNAAHALGLGPQAMVNKIQAFFGDGREREVRLNELQSIKSQSLEKKCLTLMKYALPSESFSTQLHAWKGIVMLTTRYPGLRRIFLNCKHIRGVGTSRDSIFSLWDRSRDRPDRDPHDLDFQSFAAACVADEDISGILEKSSCPSWCLDETNDQPLSVIERLLVASDSEYLTGILELPSFWCQESSMYPTVVHKILLRTADILKDLGVDIVQDTFGPHHCTDVVADTDGVDSFCQALLIGIQSWMLTLSDLRDQCWYRDLVVVTCLLRQPRAEDLLPKSWTQAKSSYLETMVRTPYSLQEFDLFIALGRVPVQAAEHPTLIFPLPRRVSVGKIANNILVLPRWRGWNEGLLPPNFGA
ncbi:hypothetical protein C8R44DRAFT_952180 [Mycena epipterygia]|nr:hypothetical protein C8R44DRAFT_952180 [Mycena epipterygia]